MNDRGRLDEKFKSFFTHILWIGICSGTKWGYGYWFCPLQCRTWAVCQTGDCQCSIRYYGENNLMRWCSFSPYVEQWEQVSINMLMFLDDTIEKIVCSRTLQETAWNHSTLIQEQITEKFDIWKQKMLRYFSFQEALVWLNFSWKKP